VLVESGTNHCDDGSRAEESGEALEEGLLVEVLVVALSLLATGRQHLHSDEGESLLLEAADDRRDQTALHAVGLDGDERALLNTGKRQDRGTRRRI